MPRNDTVALLAGGDASEHEVSLRSGLTMRDALLEAGFRVQPVFIGTNGAWVVPKDGAAGEAWPEQVDGKGGVDPLAAALELKRAGTDTFVLALHGKGGEDGTIQGFLATAGLAYTGCDTTASALAMDKILLRRVARDLGIPVADECTLDRADRALTDRHLLGEWVDGALARLGLPVVLKAPALGSSVHVHIARTREEAHEAAASISALEGGLLAERFVAGTECTVPVIGTGSSARALPVIEIRPRLSSWFDLKSKYTPGGADEIVPAVLPREVCELLSTTATRLHRAIGASGVTRTDMILTKDGRCVVLEINTLPGMTRESLVPKALRAAGIGLPDLLRGMVAEARARLRGHETLAASG